MTKGRIPPRSELAQLPRTVHGGQGWKLENVEDYSHNLNPFGPPEDLGEIIATAVSDVGHYPDDSCTELKEVISKTFNVGFDCFSVGAGSSDIIRHVPNTFYEWGLEAAEGAKAVYICNPNNPTGRVEPRDKLMRIARELEEQGTILFLDETLLELVPGYTDITLSGMVGRFSNLIVANSLTKSFAIPGIRIGFGFSNPDIISEMDKVRMTWNVGQIEQTVATVLLRDKMDYVDHAAAVMAEESEIMNSALAEIGFPTGADSDSFFYFNSIESLGMTGAEFNKRMITQGISVRDCASFGDRFKGYIRYSVKDRERNCRFIAAVDAVLNG